MRLSVDPSTSPDDYEFVHRIRVRFVETDAMGIVHHSNYLAYFEETRVEYLRAIGMKESELPEIFVHDFRKNGYLPDGDMTGHAERMSPAAGDHAELTRSTPPWQELRGGRDERGRRGLRLVLEALPKPRFFLDES